ncbi:MAG: 50S ribosomal protein L15 [Syntrophales bacterium]|jgi:large subunit ribosomal protein L15|nr:50S ribosomal protein L15 [Syntrophales bacterium]MCK9527881.1 50S ribosomal protein L15 [Syntrophales bacterium]MDX9921945.1 50S ribosomal protein L15 [Syntrophales bacterium]
MKLNELKPPPGAKKRRKRVGRGDGSGRGGTSCRGTKGQNARSGGKVKPGFEGGQMPLTRRLPKRGFRNPFRQDIVAVNVFRLNAFPEGSVVDAEALLARRIIKRTGDGIKVLGKGEISVPLTVKAAGVSKSAREKIEASGGTIEVL